MADDPTIELSLAELREVTGFAAACVRPALAIFERERPGDPRPRAAIDAAQAFADGAERTRALRDCAWAAQKAAGEAREAEQHAASEAARAALAAAGAARAFELDDNPTAGANHIAHAKTLASPVVIDVLKRYPPAPQGGARAGDLIRQLDALLR